jgi:phosphatidylserine decarboxylase
MGLIRFGSRVDVFVPVGSAVRVKLGELTAAGHTVIAELPPGGGHPVQERALAAQGA